MSGVDVRGTERNVEIGARRLGNSQSLGLKCLKALEVAMAVGSDRATKCKYFCLGSYRM